MEASERIADQLIRHQIGLQRLSNGQVRKVLAMLRRVDARIIERIAKEDISSMSVARQSRLADALRAIIDSAYTDAMGQLHVDLTALSAYERDYDADLFERAIPFRYETVRPTTSQIMAAVNSRPFQGKLLREWYKDLGEVAFKRVRDAVRMGIVEGRTTSQMIADLRGTRAQGYKDGILEVSRRQAEATVRTAINHTANTARQYLYEANARVIKGVKWVAVLDGRTTAVCRGRDGQVFAIDKGPRPPAHINCRSTTVPVLKRGSDIGETTAGMAGRVPADVNYSDWLRTQDAVFQNDVLGVKKAQLFRAGGLTLDRFIDRAGQEYTLEELKARESEAWQMAGFGS